MTSKKSRVLGAYLRKKRQQAQLNQLDVAYALHYKSPQFISNFERGLCNPPLKALKHLVSLYRIDPEELIEIIVFETKQTLKKALY